MIGGLVIVRATDEAALVKELTRVIDYLDRDPEARIVDIAYTCAHTCGKTVLAVVVDSLADLRSRLASARDRLKAGGVARIRDKSGTYYFREHLLGEGGGKLAFIYPGVMSFYPDMLRDLAIDHPVCREAFDELEEALKDDPAFSPSNFIFPPAPYYRHDADIFSSGAYAQALVASYAASVAFTRLLKTLGVESAGVVGFAGGDLAAMVHSGATAAKMSRPDRLAMIADIYRVVDKAVDHAGLPEAAMITVLSRVAGDEVGPLAEFPPEKVTLALDLSPRQKIYAVAVELEDAVVAALNAAGVRTMRMELRRPFNTPHGSGVVPIVRRFADKWMVSALSSEVYSCATASPLNGSIRAVREDTAERWAKPVRFADTIQRMYDDGYRVFLEVGPRGLMTAAVEDTLSKLPHAAIALNSIHRRGSMQLRHALAMLAAVGCEVEIKAVYAEMGGSKLDLDSQLPRSIRRESEMRLSRAFPRLTLLSTDNAVREVSALAEPKGRGAKVAARAAALAAKARRNRQFDFGALNPLVSDADILAQSPGVSIELKKTFSLADAPFLGDSAIGSSQLSYSDPNLRGLVLLTLPTAAEIMAETALMVAPNLRLSAIEDLASRGAMVFKRDQLTLIVKAERVASANAAEVAVKVMIREDLPNNAFTWSPVEATVILSREEAAPRALSVAPMTRPRTVHWSGREVYPSRICCGRRLRGIDFVESWSETGLDFELVVPPQAGNVAFTRFPLWAINPLLMEVAVSSFRLWRSHERFAGAYSFPMRLRRLELYAPMPPEGSHLNGYLRLTGVTPKSHLCEISVSDGNGNAVMTLSGWEEFIERVDPKYRALVMTPAASFITEPFSAELMGSPATEVASAFVTDVPYSVFDRDGEIWIKVFSRIVLSDHERHEFDEMSGSAARRTEWLFGRLAAKEAVRRFVKDYYQARWSDADVIILTDDKGKPYAIGEWNDYLSSKIDIAIAHTANFIVALAASNARVGVDVESSERDLSAEFIDGVFNPEEKELAATAPNSSQAMIRFWCAKEAVSKALGTGIRYSPTELVIASYQVDSGQVGIKLTGSWEEAFRKLKGREILVTVRNLHEHALAFCFIPMALFDEN